MRIFPLLAGCSMANHTDTAYSMELSEVDDNAFEIMHCNNPTTDYPEMKARVIHRLYVIQGL